MQQYSCVQQSYGTETIYDREHVARFAHPNGKSYLGLLRSLWMSVGRERLLVCAVDAFRGVRESIPREGEGGVGYECPQGGLLSAVTVQRAPRIHVPSRHGYPCGPVLCPQAPAVSHPKSASLAPPWMFPCPPTTTATSPSAYAFAPSMPCIPPSSIYHPVVYPQPMFLQYMPHPMSPRIHPIERGATNASDAEQMDGGEVRLAFVCSSHSLPNSHFVVLEAFGADGFDRK